LRLAASLSPIAKPLSSNVKRLRFGGVLMSALKKLMAIEPAWSPTRQT
jgi:hypothetical protein